MKLRSVNLSRIRALASFLIFLGACSGAAAQHVVFEQQTAVTGPVYCQPVASITDAQGNVIVTGTAESKVLTEKFNYNDALVYRNEFDMPPAFECIPQTLAEDKVTGDTIVAGYVYDYYGYSEGTFLLSITSGGSTRWKIVDPSCTSVDQLLIDASGNPIVMAEAGTYGSSSEELCKYQATTGSKLLGKALSLGSGSESASCLSLVQDPAGNLYALVTYDDSTGGGTFVARFNEATGTAIWTSYVGGVELFVLPGGKLAVFSSATIENSPQLQLFVMELSTSTGAQIESFAEPLASSAGALTSLQVTSDASGAMYFSAGMEDYTSFIPNVFQVGKLTPSGVVAYIDTLPNAISAPSIQIGTGGELFMAYEGQTGSETVAQALSASGETLWEHASQAYPGAPTLLLADSKLSIAGVPYSFGYAFNFAIDAAYFDEVGFDYSNFSQGYSVVSLDPASGAAPARVTNDPIDTQNNPISYGSADQSGNIYTLEQGYEGLVVRKRFEDGTLLWSTSLNPARTNFAGLPSGIQWTPDGRVTVAFSTPSVTGDFNAGLANLDASTGAVYWDQIYDDPFDGGFSIEYMNCDSKGHVVIAGEPYFVGGTIVTQFDEQTGAKLWDYENGNPMTSFASDASGGTVMCGNDETYTGYQIARINSEGTQFYNRDITVPGSDLYDFYELEFSLASDPAGNAYVSYWDYTYTDLHLDIYSPEGAPGPKNGNDIIAEASGDYYGYPPTLTYDGVRKALYAVLLLATDSGSSVETLKVSPEGALLWFNVFSNANYNYPTNAVLDSNGNLIILGVGEGDTSSSVQNWLRKLTPTGAVKYQYTYTGGLSSPYDDLYGLAVGADNEPFVFGGYPSAAGYGTLSSLVFKIGENTAPVCLNSTFTAPANSLTTIEAPGVLSSGTNLDGATAVLVSPPANAGSFTLNSDGSFEYEPLYGFTGKDTFTIQAVNSYGTSNVATVTVIVP